MTTLNHRLNSAFRGSTNRAGRRCFSFDAPQPLSRSPLYIQRGEGAYVYDLEGKRFIDFNMSNGAALLGTIIHASKRLS